MKFTTTIAGIPCQCEVTHYAPEVSMRITGFGFGDADPPEPAEFEFRILDRKGYKAAWLEAKMTPKDEARLLHEYEELLYDESFAEAYELAYDYD